LIDQKLTGLIATAFTIVARRIVNAHVGSASMTWSTVWRSQPTGSVHNSTSEYTFDGAG